MLNKADNSNNKERDVGITPGLLERGQGWVFWEEGGVEVGLDGGEVGRLRG